MEFRDPYYRYGLGEFTSTSKDAVISLLSLFGEANSMGIFLKEEDQIKLKFLMAMMTASKSSRKPTYAT